ncbi:MAG: TPM domain-containing protein [Lachnospiraceae bacterium]|nr:TPM domain-containing protein [Lachnospiraceae bacterium]
MSVNKAFRYLVIQAVAVMSLVLFVRPAFAYEAQYFNKESGYGAYIIDEEDLLTDEEEEELLYDHMKPITEYGGVSFVTTSSENAEKTAADFCYSLFNNDSGTTLAIDMGDRKISIMSSGAIYKTINKSYGNIITDNIYSYATEEDYLGCAEEGFDEMLVKLEGGRIAEPMRYVSNFLMAIVFALVFNFIYVWFMKGKVSVDSEALIAAAAGAVIGTAVGKNLVNSRKVRHTSSSGSGGSGGGGGGGFSGGGGSHSF